MRIKKWFQQAHIEIARNPLESYNYCGKDESRVEGPLEFGPIPKPRKNVKGDTAAFNKACIEEGPEKMVAEGKLHMRDYMRVKQATILYKLNTEKLDENPELKNEWIWGPPGAGKSRQARDENPELYVKALNKWWDGYKGEPAVLLDDVGHDHKFLGYFLKVWGDHYPFNAEVKGGTSRIRPKKVIVTSNYKPEEIWTDKAMISAIQRRFKTIQKVKPFIPYMFVR